MKKQLTRFQMRIYQVIEKEIRKNGYPPSIREICKEVGLSSTASVYYHLKVLEEKGYIRRAPSKNRSIEVLSPDFYNSVRNDLVEVPIVGQVTAGIPILAVENIEDTFPMPVEYVKNDTCFMLRVRGDSMIGAGIYHRDLILVRQQQDADNGDIVVALMDDSATVKTYYRDGDHIRLQPENPAYDPIISDDVNVLGKVIALFRKL